MKKLFRGTGLLGFGEAIWKNDTENTAENIKESSPKDILNDWEHLIEDDGLKSENKIIKIRREQ